MPELNSTVLFDMTLEILPGYQLPAGPTGTRIIAPFTGGTFEGPRISGKVLPAGGDWLTIRNDGIMVIDVRATLEATDGAIIHASYGGRIVVPAALMGEVLNPETVGDVDPAGYYFRSTPAFEVAVDSGHAWLNGIVAVGVGKFIKGGVSYRVYAID